MTVYYVTHPNLNERAKVYAPSTEKARTTFLDYLERNGLIDRGNRHTFRTNMVAERLEDPEAAWVPLELHYGYEEDGSYRLEPTQSLPQYGEEYVEPIGYEEPIGEPELPMEEEPPIEPRLKLSPIQKLALGVKE